ncbi:hypothetical protein V5O48_000933 [Marasmius crinis-equi]|uniref:DUF6533 domain-containing protein n=1 Tax=Marasmius crinis-equi TaxID=585013 RepID=A0ABR3G0U3_9AGAR
MADNEAEHFIYVTQVYFCAMYAVVIWDWLVSLTREWRYIWKTHWTPVKVAYLFCRQVIRCQFVSYSSEFASSVPQIPVGLAMWNQVGSESVLLIRTYAFFNRNIYVLCFLISALSGVVAYQLYVDTTQMLLLPFVKPDKGPCLPMSKPHAAHLLGFFIAPLLFDTLVTSMTIMKAFSIRRCNGGPSSRLIQTFLREGVFYYILISIANLINGIFYLQPRQVISAINIPLSVMMAPVLACRLILDLRERGSETVSHSDGTGVAAFTTKTASQPQCSPFTPPHRSKSFGYSYGSRNARTYDSNVVLSTLGSVALDPMDSMEQDVCDIERDSFGLAELGSLSTAIGGADGEPLPAGDAGSNMDDDCDSEPDTPTPSHRSPASGYGTLEMGFRPGRVPSTSERGVGGIRVDVEKATATM